MTAVPVPTRRRAPAPLLPARYRLLALWLLIAFGSVVFLMTLETDHRVVLTPAVVCVNLFFFYLAVLYRRDGELPVFECGTLCVAATTMYSVFPMINLVLGGMRWQRPADYRLVHFDPTPQEMGAFTWNHVLYLGTFVVTYLLVRGSRRAPHAIAPVPYPLRLSVIITFAVMMTIVNLLRFIALPPEASISAYEGGNLAYRANVPLVALQFINIGGNALNVLKLLFAILVLSRWRERKWRMVLYLWLPFEFLSTFRGLSRGPLVVLLLSLGIVYHRLVKPFTMKQAIALGALLIGGFLSFGFFRDMTALDTEAAMIANNEFQGLYANAYDVYMKKKLHQLPEPPPQLFWSDLYMLVPSQILPFYKWDPTEWYAEVLTIRDTGLRTMWGVMAQSMLGRGKPEVFLRALALALVLALLHRWYVKRAEHFWPTALYAYVCVWTFYTFRSTSFGILYFVVYYFGAAAFLVIAVKLAISGNMRRKLNR